MVKRWLGCYIRFEAIDSGGNKGILYNLSNKRDKILEVQGGYNLKGLGDPTVEQEDKRLHCGEESQIRRSKVRSEVRSKIKFQVRSPVLDFKLGAKIGEQVMNK